MSKPIRKRTVTSIALAAVLALSACGGSTDTDSSAPTQVSSESQASGPETATGQSFIELIGAADAKAIIDSAPENLVVLDVRTPEEYDEAHLANATLVDFYDDDFADQLAGLDRDVPYVLYCRSGNRSGQTVQIMRDLGFTEVHEIKDGINSWLSLGYPTE